MMIALPNMDGSFTVTCFFPFAGPTGFDVLARSTDDVVLNFFKQVLFPFYIFLMI